jgi:hypothetical protein
MNQPVYLYYKLHNFYQNHRKYVKSFDTDQLLGRTITPSQADKSCKPLGKANNVTFLDGTTSSEDAIYYPCGLIANSLFSDDISNLTCHQSDYEFSGGLKCSPSSESKIIYEFSANGIAWPSDKDKYDPPNWSQLSDQEIKRTYVPPQKWMSSWPEQFGYGYNKTNIPNLKTWERFQVWMRVAGTLPRLTLGLYTFRKLYGKNKQNLLPAGVWEISVVDKFSVTRFGGKKSIVISTVSFLGGKNPFLGIAYMVVGAVCLLLGVLFLARHTIKPRKLGDHSHLSWNKEQNGVGNY